MPRRLRATPDVAWQIDSVSVRTRDGPKRVEQAYRILVEGRAMTHQRSAYDLSLGPLHYCGERLEQHFDAFW
ncbi:MAG TPA: hypothetical protein VKP69_31320 [Isosphaeraceae bacterium]|nr:hypothetical protein [Isosphaeraceae bacterium]